MSTHDVPFLFALDDKIIEVHSGFNFGNISFAIRLDIMERHEDQGYKLRMDSSREVDHPLGGRMRLCCAMKSKKTKEKITFVF